jgi:arylsulfatase A-like enzyme
MPRPNILVFMTDHQRGDTVLPEHPAITPNVERLARDGVTFTSAFCPSPHCCPARATFATGLYPSRHGVWNNVCNDQALARGPKPGVRLWSEDLAGAGYRMVWSGKWHVSSLETPADRGWEERFVSGYQPREHQTEWEHYRSLAAHPVGMRRGEGQILRPGYGTYTAYGTRDPDANDHDQRTVAEAIDALHELGRSKDPWVLYVGLIGPHDPYLVPARYLDRYRLEDVALPPSHADTLEDKPRVYGRMRERWAQLTERETREAIRHYRAYCTYLDELFGSVLDALDTSGQAQDTMTVYLADHGDYCGDHGLFAKGIPCFRGAYHVPAVVRWPAGVAAPGRRVSEMISLADFAPTFLEAAGVPAERSFSGASLAPFLRGEAPAGWRDEIHTQCNGVETYFTQRSVTTARHKYVWNGFDDDELYDLERDPHEMRNLARDPACAGVVREMSRRMWRFARREEDSAIQSYITVALAPYGPGEAFAED